MSKAQTYLLQLWRDERGFWAVLKAQQGGKLYQFEHLEELAQFLLEHGAYPQGEEAGIREPLMPVMALQS